MIIFVYNENCVMAGCEVPQRYLDAYDDPDNGGDWHAEDITEENVAWHEFRGLYGRRVANTLRRYLEQF